MVVVVPWYLPLRFGRVAEEKYPPQEFVGGGAFHPEITNILNKLGYLSIPNGFERSINLWIAIRFYTILQKIAGILNFDVNMRHLGFCVF